MSNRSGTEKSNKLSKEDQQLEAMGNSVIGVFIGLKKGIKSLKSSQGKVLTIIFVTMLCFGIFYLRDYIIESIIPDEDGFHILKLATVAILGFPMVLLYMFGTEGEVQKGSDEFEKMFASIGFCSKGKVYPEYLGKEEENKVVTYLFRSPGISILEWRGRKVELETVLDCNIIDISNAKGTKQLVNVKTVPSKNKMESNILWSNSNIIEKDFEVTVGKTLLDDVTFDFNKAPHALIAGVTGGGKSVLLRCILWQFIYKGAKIYMIDFKGGVEFGKQYEQFGEVVANHQEALEVLKELTRENKMRLALFRENEVKNIVEYNEKFPKEKLCRIGLFCDEISEMLDKTGLSKEDKIIFYEIEKEMSTLARLSRATGINMLLATQRPDAKVIAGQIKNNLPIRISGRMVDPQASEMVLGNTMASRLDETKGRFMYNIGSDTYEFQAYNFSDDNLKSGNYLMGGMLIDSMNWDDEDIEGTEDYQEIDESEQQYDYVDDEYQGF